MTDAKKLLEIAFRCRKHAQDRISLQQIRELFLEETGSELPEFTKQLAILLEGNILKRVRDNQMKIKPEEFWKTPPDNS